MVAVGQLALVDQEARLDLARGDRRQDLVERHHLVLESPPRKIRRTRYAVVCGPGSRPRPLQLVPAQLLVRDHDRAVAGAHARAVRQQQVAVLHERPRGGRERGHLEPSLLRPLVQRLDVGGTSSNSSPRVSTRSSASAQTMNASSGSGL